MSGIARRSCLDRRLRRLSAAIISGALIASASATAQVNVVDFGVAPTPQASPEPAGLKEVLVDVADDGADGEQNRAVGQMELNDQVLEQWAFGEPLEQSRTRFRRMVTQGIDGIDGVCELTPEQKRRLRLVAEAGRQQLEGRLRSVKTRYAGRKIEQNRLGEVHGLVSTIQAASRQNPLEPGSLLAKSLTSILTADQRSRWQAWELERERQSLRREIHAAIATIDLSLPMTDRQRRDLTRLLEAHVRPVAPPRPDVDQQEANAFRQIESMPPGQLALAQFHAIPVRKIQAILRPEQLEVLQSMYRSLRPRWTTIENSGLLRERIDLAGDAEREVRP